LPTFSAPQATEMPLAQPTHFERLYSHAFYPIGIGVRYAPLCWNASQAVKLHRNCRMLGFGSGAAHSPIGATSQESLHFPGRDPFFKTRIAASMYSRFWLQNFSSSNSERELVQIL